MSLFHNITRGGQTNIHFIAMLRQVTKMAMLFSILISLSLYSAKVYTTIPKTYWASYSKYYSHELNPFLLFITDERYSPHRAPLVLKRVNFINKILEKNIPLAVKTFCISLSVIALAWFWIGFLKRRKKHKRGNKIVHPLKLRWLIKKNRQESDLKIGPLPLIKDKETSHIVVSGTTGTGKTNCFNILMPQIRKRRNKAIVVDLTGQLISRFYQEGDIILNPFDKRTVHWSPWAECLYEPHYEMIATGMITTKKHLTDPFWDNSARMLFSTAMQKLESQNKTSIKELHRLLTMADENEFEEFFRGTEALAATQKKGERMTLSIRSVLTSQMRGFKYLKDEGKSFSIREWIEDEATSKWIFMTANSDQLLSLKPLISCWLEIAFTILMSLEESMKRRVWFIIDELPALQHIPCLADALSRSRKYGACVISGIQAMSQLYEIYGQSGAQTILDLFNTCIFFKSTNPRVTSWISKFLGEAEETEMVENLSYGANTIRDGVSLNERTQVKPIVIPTEIQLLEDLQAYIKLPGNYLITKLKLPYQDIPKVCKPFETKLIPKKGIIPCQTQMNP